MSFLLANNYNFRRPTITSDNLDLLRLCITSSSIWPYHSIAPTPSAVASGRR
ncbi:hypothetical protein Hanom_Chr16g01450651 [Helianthus anomalus]